MDIIVYYYLTVYVLRSKGNKWVLQYVVNK